LVTTLAAAAAGTPKKLTEWPNPAGPLWTADVRRGFVGAVNLAVLGRDKFFGLAGCPLRDWPNPRGPLWASDVRQGFQNAAEVHLIGKDAFFAAAGEAPRYDWPNPRGPVWTADLRQGFQNPAEIHLVGKDKFFGLAGSPTFDWPNPLAASRRHDHSPPPNLLAGPLGTTPRPVGFAGEQPTPAAARWGLWLHHPSPNLLVGTLARPVGLGTTNDQPNPRAAASAAGWAAATPLNLVGRDRFFAAAGVGPQYDWVNPRGPRPLPVNDPVTNTLVTVLATPTGTPKKQTEWPNPRGPLWTADLRQGFAGSVPLNLLGKDKLYGGAGEVPAYDWSTTPAAGRGQPPLTPPNLAVGTLARPVGSQEYAVADWRGRRVLPESPPNLLVGTLARPVGSQELPAQALVSGWGRRGVHDVPTSLLAGLLARSGLLLRRRRLL
jgi:hypothetical protein